VLGDKPPTPKDLAVAYDVPYFAKLLHTLGLFGTDGLEHLHQMVAATKARMKSIQNAQKRAASEMEALTGTQQTNADQFMRDREAQEARELKKSKKGKEKA